MTHRLPLRRRDGTIRAWAHVDDDDVERLTLHVWRLGTVGYAVRYTREEGSVYLHRVVTNATPGLDVDHLNHDKLDNRKANLRVVSHAQNIQNRRGANARSGTGLRGVSRRADCNRYVAQVSLDGRHHYLGLYTTPEEAAAVAAAFRAEHMPGAREVR